MLKKITLCADDFGFNHDVSMGILRLAQQRRLSAISCMVNMQAFAALAPQLIALAPSVQIGLHFNLTEGYFLSQKNKKCFSLPELLLKTHARCVSRAVLQQELIAQLHCFKQHMGRWPDFIDGHQHVHQFPVIRSILLDVCQELLPNQSFFIRSVWPMYSVKPFQMKAHILTYTGSKALHGVLNKNALSHNPCFAGIYDFSAKRSYRELFVQWVRAVPDNTLIMCHPGEGLAVNDGIAQARCNEMTYFSSQEFIDDCEQEQVRLFS